MHEDKRPVRSGNATAHSLVLLLVIVAVFAAQGCVGLTSAGSPKTSNSDATAPVTIDAPVATNITASGATIVWTTTVPASSQVDYGTTSSYGSQTTLNMSMVTSHSQSLSGLTAGQLYDYRALSTDASNNLATSGNLTFTTSAAPDTTPPTVSITAPTAGAIVSGAVPVTANASDNVGVASVQFQLDSANVGSLLTTAPYSYSWNTTTASSGSHTVRAIAKDAAGNTTTSAGVGVTVNNNKAAATVTLGNLTQTYDAAAESATATTTPSGLAVTFAYSQNGNAVAAPTSAGSYSVTGTVNDPNYQGSAVGTLTINKAAAAVTLGNLTQTYDGAAESATATTTPSGLAVTFAYSQNGNAIVAPTNTGSYGVTGTVNNANYQGSAVGTLTINKGTATVTLGNLTQTYDGAAESATATTTPSGLAVTFAYSQNGNPVAAPTSVGSYSVTATVNNANYQGSANGTFTINAADTTPPTVSMTAPASGATVSGDVTISANASDNVGVAGVQFLLDGANLGAQVTSAPYSMVWGSTTTINGTHTLSARAHDAAGNSTTSAAVTVTVSNAATAGSPTSYTYYTPTGAGWHDLGSTTAMQPNGIGGAGDTCPSSTYGNFGANFDSGCWNVMAAWSSGIVDQANRRMIMWGGGHTDYGGNEVYGLQVGSTNQFTRYNGPSQPCNAPSEACTSPAGPNARHTYGGLAYMSNTQQMLVIGGTLHGTASMESKAAWLLNMAGLNSGCAAGANQISAGCTATWTEVTGNLGTYFTLGGGVGFDQPFTDYWDSTLGPLGDNCVYVFFPGGGDFGNYCAVQGNTGAGVFNDISYIGGSQTGIYGTIEQKSGIFIFAGAGELWGVQISGCPAGNYAGSATCGKMVDHSSASGCGSVIAGYYPSVAYDEAAAQLGNDDILLYPGSGQIVTILHTGGSNSATWTCSTESLGSNTPTAGTSNGVFGRFRYMRLEDAFIYCPSVSDGSSTGNNADCWSYRRRASGFATSSERTLAYRAANPGVTRATNFTTADLVNDDGSGHGSIESDWSGSFSDYSQDTSTVPAEGAGIDNAWKIIAPAVAAANNSPTFHVCMDIYHNYADGGASDCVATYGPTGNRGNTVYFQVRWRADNNAINVEPGLEGPSQYGGEGWKIFGIHGLNDGTDSTCQGLGQVIQNTFWGGFVQGFQNCGSGANFVYGTDPNNGSGVIWENGYQAESAGYNCGYLSKPSCATFAPNTWYTFYCKWYIPSYTEGPIYPNGSGSLECWWQPAEGAAMQKIFSFIGWSYNYNNYPSDNYGRLELYDYDTDRSPSGTFVQQTFWYSELIVSSQPICAPYGTYNGNCYPGN